MAKRRPKSLHRDKPAQRGRYNQIPTSKQLLEDVVVITLPADPGPYLIDHGFEMRPDGHNWHL